MLNIENHFKDDQCVSTLIGLLIDAKETSYRY